MSIGLAWKKFLSVFPLESRFFKSTYDTPHSDQNLSVMRRYFEQMTAGEESCQMLSKDSKDVNLHFQAEKNGGSIFCATYKQPTADGGFTEHVAVAVLELSQSTPDSLSVTPHFVLTGEKRTHLGQEMLFVDGIVCRIHHPENNNKPTMTAYDINDPDAISAGLCYAADCFQRILSSLPLDVSSSEKWFEVSGTELNKRAMYITTRTQQQLTTEIKNL